MSRSKELAPEAIPDEKVRSAYGSLVEAYVDDEARVRTTWAAFVDALGRLIARWLKLVALERRPALGLTRTSPRVQSPAKLLGDLLLGARTLFASVPEHPPRDPQWQPPVPQMTPEAAAREARREQDRKEQEAAFAKAYPKVAVGPGMTVDHGIQAG